MFLSLFRIFKHSCIIHQAFPAIMRVCIGVWPLHESGVWNRILRDPPFDLMGGLWFLPRGTLFFSCRKRSTLFFSGYTPGTFFFWHTGKGTFFSKGKWRQMYGTLFRPRKARWEENSYNDHFHWICRIKYVKRQCTKFCMQLSVHFFLKS